MRIKASRGFTLLEILVVVIILALSLSIIFPQLFPVLTTNYDREKVMDLVKKINSYRWKAFEKKKMVLIYEDKGVLTTEIEGKTMKFWSPSKDVALVMSDALVCMPNGAVNGVTLKIDFGSSLFYIDFTPFDGKAVITERK